MKYLWDLLIVIAGGLVVTFFVRFWDRKSKAKFRPAKLRKNCVIKIQHCINELDFNAKCVGGSMCPFKTEALEKLLNSVEISLLNEDLINLLKQQINEAGIARAPYCEVVSVRVRARSKMLKRFFQEKIIELTTNAKT